MQNASQRSFFTKSREKLNDSIEEIDDGKLLKIKIENLHNFKEEPSAKYDEKAIDTEEIIKKLNMGMIL